MNKKVIIIIAIVLLVLACGVGYYMYENSKQGESDDRVLVEAALDYFDKYVSVYSGSSAYTITLKDLKEKNYQLDKFTGCDENKTYITITIDTANGKVIETEIEKKC